MGRQSNIFKHEMAQKRKQQQQQKQEHSNADDRTVQVQTTFKLQDAFDSNDVDFSGSGAKRAKYALDDETSRDQDASLSTSYYAESNPPSIATNVSDQSDTSCPFYSDDSNTNPAAIFLLQRPSLTGSIVLLETVDRSPELLPPPLLSMTATTTSPPVTRNVTAIESNVNVLFADDELLNVFLAQDFRFDFGIANFST